MNEQSATKRPKFCPLCQKKGLNNKLKLHQLNFTEAIYMCPNSECLFPLQGGLAESFLIKRTINAAQDFTVAAAASTARENPCSDAGTVFPGLAQNLDRSFMNMNDLIEPSTSQPPCENSNDIFDLVGWLENLGGDDLPSYADPPQRPRSPPQTEKPKMEDPPATNVQEKICVKNAVANNTGQCLETAKEIVKSPCKTKKRKNAAKTSPTKLMTTDIVAATQLQLFPYNNLVVENTAQKRPPGNSGFSVSTANRKVRTYCKPRVQDAKKQTAISCLNVGLIPKNTTLTRQLIGTTQSEPQRKIVGQPVNNFLQAKSMSLNEIINSVTIKKRPQFFVDGGNCGSTRAEKRKIANLRNKTSQEVLNRPPPPAKRRKVEPVANQVPVSLKKVYGKFGKTMYEGYRVSSKIGPEDETASEDSGIQSPNSIASAGSGSLSGSR